MSAFEILKHNIHLRGDVCFEENLFKYNGGMTKKGMVIDPDLLTWSIFDEVCKENGVCGGVEKVWYKLPHDDFSSVRVIFEEKDAGIREMCRECMTTGEVDVYLQHGISQAEPFPLSTPNGDEQESSDEEDETVKEGEHPVDDGEDPVEEGGQEDPRFQSFFEEVHNGGNVDTSAANEAFVACDSQVEDGDAQVQDEDEFERQCQDAPHPEPAVDTDDEWDEFNRTEAEISRVKYQKEKPPYLWLMQTFDSGEEFKDQLLRYVLKTNYDVKLVRWEPTKLAAVCRDEGCKWKIYCSVEKPKGKWMVKTYVDAHHHTKTGKARMLKQGVIARLFRDEARRRPGLRWTDIKDEIMMRYTISVSKWICMKARRLALDLVIETQKQQFAKLWDYEGELHRGNKDIRTEIVTIPTADGKQKFDKFYISFEPLRRTWKNCCRPIIGLDGAFLKWEIKGEILAAVGRDADNRIYPIAWAIVRVEDNESWAWFVGNLKRDLDLGLGNGFTVISDKQKGLINAVADLLPNVEHRHCARHIFANWRKVYSHMAYESFFWVVAYSGNEGDYDYNMEDLKKYDPLAYDDLLKTEPKTWCRAFFSNHASCEDVSNNLSESFNRTIVEARKLPVINMLEEIRRQAMKRISKRREKTENCLSKFPPHIMEILEANRKASKFCQVLTSSESVYEVTEGNASYEVIICNRHCACNQWNITGIPCKHAIHVITEHNRDPEDYVDKLYLTTFWQATYKDNIKPANGDRLWKKTGKEPIQIPDKRKKRGRRKKFARIREPHESSQNPTKVTREGRTMTCTNCLQTGHNRSTCTRPAVQSAPPRKRGRPRKNPDNDDPWSIHNAPKRWRNAQSQPPVAQSQPTVAQSQHTSDIPQHSSAPTSNSRGGGNSRGRGNGRGRGRPPGRGRGRGKGRGRAEPPDPATRSSVFLMSPWTDKVFDVWQPNNP